MLIWLVNWLVKWLGNGWLMVGDVACGGSMVVDDVGNGLGDDGDACGFISEYQ